MHLKNLKKSVLSQEEILVRPKKNKELKVLLILKKFKNNKMKMKGNKERRTHKMRAQENRSKMKMMIVISEKI